MADIIAYLRSPRKPLCSNMRNRKVPYFEHLSIPRLEKQGYGRYLPHDEEALRSGIIAVGLSPS